MGRVGYIISRFLKHAFRGLSTLFLLVAFVPTLFYLYPELPKYFLFDNKAPRNNYNPSSYQLNGFNFYLPSRTSLIPVWVLLPERLKAKSLEAAVGHLKGTNITTILYFHGNTHDRAEYRRVSVYRNLTEAGYPVVAFDYRGFGENSGDTSGYSVVEDAKIVHRWLETKKGKNKVVWWSHSFGCAVAARTARDLLLEYRTPLAIVSESPFQSFRSIMQDSSMYSKTLGSLPSFISEFVLQNVFYIYGIDFEVDIDLGHLNNTSILHLHAVDDNVIKVKHAYGLKEYMTKHSKYYTSIVFGSCRKYQHHIAYLAPEIVPLFEGFLKQAMKDEEGRAKIKKGINKINGTIRSN